MPPPKIWLTTVAAMKSGSLRAIPSRPKRIVDCGTSIGVTCRVPAPAKAAGATGSRLAFSGSGPNTSSRWAGERRCVDRADGGDLERVARKGRGAHVNQIGARQRRQRGKIAAHGQAIGMVWIGQGAESSGPRQSRDRSPRVSDRRRSGSPPARKARGRAAPR